MKNNKKHDQNVPVVAGAGGGGKGGGSTRTPREAPDSLHNTAYARVIDLLSEGEIGGLVNGTDSIFLNKTPLTRNGVRNFEGVRVTERKGLQRQAPLDGFPAVENGVSVGIELRDDAPWIQEFSNPELSAVRVQLSVPRLSKVNTSNGDTNGHTVRYAIDLATDGGPYREVLNRSFSGKTSTTYSRSHDITLPQSASRWTIRVRRLTANANSNNIADQTLIDSYTEIIDGRFTYPNSAVVGLQVSAEHFQGIPSRAYDIYGVKVRVPDNYDPQSRTYSGTWSGGWKVAWTNNPAWIYLDLATHPRYGLGDRINLGMMDKWSLYEIARYCDQRVPDGFGGTEPRFTCNTYLQSRENAYDLLQKLASVFRGMSYYASGTVTAVADQPKSSMFLYTNSNVVDGVFNYSGSPKSQRYTAALVSYNDPDDFFEQRVEYVEDRSGMAKYGYQETQMTAFGCSSRGQAHRAGKWALLTSQLETQLLTFSVGLEGVYARPGDLIKVMDQDLIGEPKGGRVAASTIRTITTDFETEVEVGDSLSVTLATGVIESRTISSVNGKVLTVSQDFSSLPEVEGSWATQGEVRLQTYRVLGITEKEEGTQYEFRCVEYREDKYDAIELGTKLEQRPVTAIPPSVQPPPENVTLSQRVVVTQGIANTIATIAWDAPEHAIAYEGFWRKDEGEWISFGRTGSTSVEIPNIYAGRYVARVYAINALDVRSVAATSVETQLSGKTTPPPVVTHLLTEGGVYKVDLSWGFAAQGAEDVQRTEIWISPTPQLEDAAKFTDLAYPQNRFSHVGMRAGDGFYYWARLVDRSGNFGSFYPIGDGVYGASSAEADDYLDAIRDHVLTTENAEHLLGDMVDGVIVEAVEGVVDGMIVDAVDSAVTRPIAESQEMLRLMTEAERHIREDEDAITTRKVEILEAEVTENIAATITHLQEVIVTANSALAQDVLTLESKVDDNHSEINQTLTTLAEADSAMAQSISTLESKVDEDIGSAITTLQQTIADAESTLATSITELESRVNNEIVSSIETLQTTMASEDAALAQSISALQSQITDDIGAAISDLQTTVADGDQALAQSIETLESQFGDDLSAAVSNLQSAISSGDQTLAQSIGTLETQFGDNLSSAVSSLQSAISSGDQALAQSVETLESQFEDDLNAAVSSLQSAISSGDQTLAQSIETLETQFGDDLSAAVSTLQTAISSGDQAVAQTVTNLETQMGSDISSAINALQTTLTDADQALAQTVSNLESQFGDDLSAAVQSLQTAIADGDSALSTTLSGVSSQVGNLSADVQATSSALATTDGKLNSMFHLKTSVTSGGHRYFAGLGLGVENDPNGPGFISQVLIQADRLALMNVSNDSVTIPFSVQDGQTFINSAVIQNASISFAKISNDIQSSNYIANQSGWRLDKDGNFQLNGPGGTGRLEITNNLIRVYGSNGQIRIRLGIW